MNTLENNYENEAHEINREQVAEIVPVDVLSRLESNLIRLQFISDRIGFLLSEVKDLIKSK